MHLFEILNIKCVHIFILLFTVCVHMSATETDRDAESETSRKTTKDDILNFGIGNIVDCNNKLLPEAELTFQRGYVKQIRLTLKYYELIQETWSQIETTTVEDVLLEFNSRIEYLQSQSEQLFSEINSNGKTKRFTPSDLDELKRVEEEAGEVVKQLDNKVKESKTKWTEETGRLNSAIEKSNEAQKNLAYHVLDMAFKCDIENLQENLDETIWRVRGTDITTHSEWMLERIKELHRSAKQLESLGYLKDTKDADADDRSDEVETELKTLEETKGKIVEYMKEHMSVIGPSQLLSFMMDGHRLVTQANELKVQERKKYNSSAKKQLKELKRMSQDIQEYRKVMEERVDKGGEKSRVEDEL